MQRDIYVVSLPRPTQDGLRRWTREQTRRMVLDSLRMGGILPPASAAGAKVFIETRATTELVKNLMLQVGFWTGKVPPVIEVPRQPRSDKGKARGKRRPPAACEDCGAPCEVDPKRADSATVCAACSPLSKRRAP